VKISKKVSIAIHILLVTHYFADITKITGKLLTRSTGCNPVIVRTIVSALKKAGFLGVTRGAKSSTTLIKDPEEITLRNICEAVDPDTLNNFLKGIHSCSSPQCPIGKRIVEVLENPYQRITEVIENAMEGITLKTLFDGFSSKEINHHRELIKQITRP
jgi:DNA-binding IscR family transcriptional regulator